MSRLITAVMARNEASRFWRSALEAWASFSDEIVVLDDNSEDDTRAIADRAGALTFPLGKQQQAWGDEAPARAHLWNLALDSTSEGDYILFTDADQTPARDPRPLLDAKPGAVAFPLYDLWHEDAYGRLWYREDRYWQAHLHPRIWLIRRPEEPPEGWRWSQRGIHSGHLAANYAAERILFAPAEYGILHYGYHTEAIRKEKLERYASVRDQLTSYEWEHASSIADPQPRLKLLPFDPELRLSLAE